MATPPSTVIIVTNLDSDATIINEVSIDPSDSATFGATDFPLIVNDLAFRILMLLNLVELSVNGKVLSGLTMFNTAAFAQFLEDVGDGNIEIPA